MCYLIVVLHILLLCADCWGRTCRVHAAKGLAATWRRVMRPAHEAAPLFLGYWTFMIEPLMCKEIDHHAACGW